MNTQLRARAEELGFLDEPDFITLLADEDDLDVEEDSEETDWDDFDEDELDDAEEEIDEDSDVADLDEEDEPDPEDYDDELDSDPLEIEPVGDR